MPRRTITIDQELAEMLRHYPYALINVSAAAREGIWRSIHKLEKKMEKRSG